MDIAAVAAASSTVGAVAVTDLGADVAEAAITGAVAVVEDMPGAGAVAEAIGPGATAIPGMDTLNPTIETAIRAMAMNESVLLTLMETVTREMATVTRPAKNRLRGLLMKKLARMLRPRSS
jgi:hypothetical protein